MSGQLVGARSAQGVGEAKFSGSLLVRGDPLITEAQFGIAFGTGDETIKGVGLIEAVKQILILLMTQMANQNLF